MSFPLSPAIAIWKNRAALAAMLPQLREARAVLQKLMGEPRDFVHQQWLQITSLIYEFNPDLIIELGRGHGNSTCAMALSAYHLGSKVDFLSVCLSANFGQESRPYLSERLCDPLFLSIVDAQIADIANFDFRRRIDDARRCFIFWDAHGLELSKIILQRIIKPVSDKEHCVVVHDMADLHYHTEAHRTCAPEPWIELGTVPPRFILGDVGMQYEEGVALVDFMRRNRNPFRSAESSYFPELSENQICELRRLFGDDFSRYGFWYYFSLNEVERNGLTFPTQRSLEAYHGYRTQK